jgi:hypothetical protein
MQADHSPPLLPFQWNFSNNGFTFKKVTNPTAPYSVRFEYVYLECARMYVIICRTGTRFGEMLTLRKAADHVFFGQRRNDDIYIPFS